MVIRVRRYGRILRILYSRGNNMSFIVRRPMQIFILSSVEHDPTRPYTEHSVDVFRGSGRIFTRTVRKRFGRSGRGKQYQCDRVVRHTITPNGTVIPVRADTINYKSGRRPLRCRADEFQGSEGDRLVPPRHFPSLRARRARYVSSICSVVETGAHRRHRR